MDKKTPIQDWHESLQIGAKGVQEVSAFLESHTVKTTWRDTELVHNVEQDPRYQKHDIDLLWVIPVGEFLRCHTIEVKTDRNHHTGNFFFETVSVEQRNKPGAFVITRAEWLFYLFFDAGMLYCFPMEELKPWFLKHEEQFKQRKSYTNNNVNMFSWSTIGRIVPINAAVNSTKHCRVFEKISGRWSAVK